MLSRAEIDALVAEATVDCNDECEQVTGLYTMIVDNLATPFSTTVLGVEVTVEDIDLTDDDHIRRSLLARSDPAGHPGAGVLHCRRRRRTVRSGSRRTGTGPAGGQANCVVIPSPEPRPVGDQAHGPAGAAAR